MTKDDEMESRVRTALGVVRLPTPSEASLDRILARRAAGECVELPTGEPGRGRLRWLVVTALAAGLGGMLLDAEPASSPGGPALAPDSVGVGFTESGEWFLPPALLAQARERAVTTGDDPDGSRLREGTWLYSYRNRMTISDPPHHLLSISLHRGEYGGEATWVLSQHRMREPDSVPVAEWDGTTPVEHLPDSAWRWRKRENLPRPLYGQRDTVWLSADRLQPLARISTREGWSREERYFEDRVLISETSNGYTQNQSVSRDEPRDQFTGLVMRHDLMLALIQGLDLHRGFKGSIGVIALSDFGSFMTTPLQLEVVGEERVRVPAGEFDCWRLEIGPFQGLFSLWVAKEGHWLVREATGPKIRGGFERVLEEMTLR